MSKTERQLFDFGPFRLDASERTLARDGRTVPLKPMVFDLLLFFAERPGRLVRKEELMEALWPDTSVQEASLTNNVSVLRKALGAEGAEYIQTEPKHGYRFVADVRSSSDAGGEVLVLEKHTLTRTVTKEVQDEEGRLGATALPASHTPVAGNARRRRALAPQPSLVVAALLLVGAVTAFGLYRLASQRRARDGAAGVPFREMDISRLTTSGKTTHATISPDGKYVAHVTVDAEGDSLWVSHVAAPTSVRIAGPAATEYVSVAFAPDGDSVYYLALDRDKGDTALYRVPVLGGPSSKAAYDVGPVGFSPDGRQMAFIRIYGDESRLIVAGAGGADERTLATRRQPELFRLYWNAPAWSPDGKTIACQARLSDERGQQYETIVGVSAEDGSQRPLTSGRWYHAGQPVWLADGSGLLVTASEGETAPVQVWHVARAGGEATRVTRDLNDYHDLSLTADGRRLVAVQDHSVSSIWVAPAGDANLARQAASDAGWIEELAWTPDGRLVYRSNAGDGADVWVMDADGSNPKQLTTGARASRGLAVSPDGRYIFFASDRAGHFNIWRADADGSNHKQLTKGGGEFYPHSTPDGRWVVYQQGEIEPRLWRVPAEGGEPVQLMETRGCRPAVSPDGSMIAYHYLDPDVDGSRWRIGVASSEGGRRLKQFDFPPTLTRRFVRWSPDRRAIAYANNAAGDSVIWAQPLDGSPPKQLTSFKGEQILVFDWSADGRTLAFVRGVETSDVVLIERRQK